MRFSQEFIQTLKNSISLIEVAQENIELRKTGNRFMGRCPFHGDRSPSFSVNKDFYYCFGCKETGDVISFVTKLQGLSFEEACEDLAEKAGIVIQKARVQSRAKKNVCSTNAVNSFKSRKIKLFRFAQILSSKSSARQRKPTLSRRTRLLKKARNNRAND